MKRSKILISLLLILAMMLSTAGVAFANKNTNQGGTFVWATFSDPINLNPCLASDSASTDVHQFLFRGLYTRDWNTSIIPDLATAMPKVTNGNKTLTIPLRKDVKWHDGQPFTADDVKFSLEFMLDKKVASPRYAYYEKIEKIETPDKYTVVIHLKEPDSALIPNLSYNYIIPKHIWEKVDRTKVRESEYNKSKPIGNGPFKFVEWKAAERVVLEANPDYYGGRPNFDKVIFNITPSQAVAMVKAETGEAHMVAVPESDIARMKSKKNLNVYVYDRAAFDCILYNTKSPFFEDKRVRQAITHALNKQAIVNGIYKGLGKPAEGSYHPKLAMYAPDVPKYAYDLEKAKKLLDEAGWKVGKDGIREKDGKKFKFVLLTNKGNIMREKLTVLVQRQLKLLGIEAEPRILEWNTFLNKYVDVGKFDAYVGGFTTNLDGDQTSFYHSDRSKGYFNKGSWKNPRVDELLDKARLTFDPAEQKKIYAEVQKIVAEEQPMTYLVYRKSGLAVNNKVKNAKIVDLLGFNSEIGSWYMTK